MPPGFSVNMVFSGYQTFVHFAHTKLNPPTYLRSELATIFRSYIMSKFRKMYTKNFETATMNSQCETQTHPAFLRS